MMNIAEITKRCGGPTKIVKEAKLRGMTITIRGVWRWNISGIRWQWFDLLMDMGDLTLEQIHHANKDAVEKQKSKRLDAA